MGFVEFRESTRSQRVPRVEVRINGTGCILSKAMVDQLGVKKGDSYTVYVDSVEKSVAFRVGKTGFYKFTGGGNTGELKAVGLRLAIEKLLNREVRGRFEVFPLKANGLTYIVVKFPQA